MALINISENQEREENAAIVTLPVLRLGFRPFYLLATAFAFISIPLWLVRYYGLATFFNHVDLNWHMHEMTFGFAIAVIIGFLYTAGRNWTGQWTPRGNSLALIAGIWIAGRLAMLLAPMSVAALIDLLFIPVAAWPLYKVLKRAGNKRNMFLIGLLSLLAVSNLAYHAGALELLAIYPITAVHTALLVITIIECAIGGRVIPMFTANAVPKATPFSHPRMDRIAFGITVLACFAWVFRLPAMMTASLCMGTAAAQAVRLAGWKPLATLHNPLLWILHVSYAWIPVGFLMLALSALGVIPASAAIHALAVGAMSGLIIGMITRTALGHTGRPLETGVGETMMYVLIQIGATARVLASVDTPVSRDALLLMASTCWTWAFCLYLFIYAPYLLRPRLDAKDG